MPRLHEALRGRRKIALYGEMGAGKTTLVNAFCQFLGVHDHTASPTFSIINEYGYTGESGEPALIHHLDLYRLNSTGEALDIGIEDVLNDPWYCLIEWPHLAEPLLPPDTAKVRMELIDETTRLLSVDV